MANTIAIREKVAELCGFDGEILPEYETSLDAINNEFDEFGLTYTLQKAINKESGDVGYDASHLSGLDTFSDTAAKALCYLFIHLMEVEG